MDQDKEYDLREDIIGLQTAQDVLDRCKTDRDRRRVVKLMLAMAERIEAQLRIELEKDSNGKTSE